MPADSTTFDAIGTRWTISADGSLDASTLARVHDRIASYDETWSRFRDDSLVARMSREAGTYRLPPEGPALLDLYDRLDERTAGAVSPLVGRSLVRLGYDADLTLRPSGAPVPAPRDALVRDGDLLHVLEPVLLDVGAAGKGQLVDLVGAELRACGVDAFLIDAGGDLLHAGDRPARVGLSQPGDPSRVIGVVELRDAALCGSGVDLRRWGDGWHHVLDARTGWPTLDVVATWTVAGSAMVADGLATALFFTDPDRLEVAFDLTYVRVHADGTVRYSLGLPGEVFR